MKNAKKKHKLEIHIPISVVESTQVYMTNPTQVFETPIEVVLLREKSDYPLVLKQIVDYFLKDDLYLRVPKLFSTNVGTHETHYIRALCDMGICFYYFFLVFLIF
jgi:hypothetical protein